MFCSTVIPTIARTTLSRAVRSVLDQSFTADDFQVIVVNDSGQPLPPADWQQSPRVQVIETAQRERCVARNAGAAIARGHYLHFLDDDDWLLPGALTTLWKLAQSSDAAWLLGGCKYVDDKGNLLTEVHLGANGDVFAQVMSPGQWVHLQSSLIKVEAFFAVGGFHPLLMVTQDIHLCRKILLHGELAETLTPVACLLRGSGWNTTTRYEHSLEFYRWGREMILVDSDTFGRMRASAHQAIWRGRMIWNYWASVRWHFKRKHLFTAMNRAILCGLVFVTAGRHLFSKDFWRGVATVPVNNAAF